MAVFLHYQQNDDDDYDDAKRYSVLFKTKQNKTKYCFEAVLLSVHFSMHEVVHFISLSYSLSSMTKMMRIISWRDKNCDDIKVADFECIFLFILSIFVVVTPTMASRLHSLALAIEVILPSRSCSYKVAMILPAIYKLAQICCLL